MRKSHRTHNRPMLLECSPRRSCSGSHPNPHPLLETKSRFMSYAKASLRRSLTVLQLRLQDLLPPLRQPSLPPCSLWLASFSISFSKVLATQAMRNKQHGFRAWWGDMKYELSLVCPPCPAALGCPGTAAIFGPGYAGYEEKATWILCMVGRSVLLAWLWVAQAPLPSLVLATQAMRKKQHGFCAWRGDIKHELSLVCPPCPAALGCPATAAVFGPAPGTGKEKAT